MGYKMKGFGGFKESPAKQKNFNFTGSTASTTPSFSSTKIGKGINKGLSVTAKGIKPLLKGALKRGTGIVGMFLGATKTATADQPKNFKKPEGEQIRNLLTKHKLKGGR